MIDLELAEDPIEKGWNLREGLRAAIFPPLQVVFSISNDDRLVEVARLRMLDIITI